jgi:hypothetical protein
MGKRDSITHAKKWAKLETKKNCYKVVIETTTEVNKKFETELSALFKKYEQDIKDGYIEVL